MLLIYLYLLELFALFRMNFLIIKNRIKKFKILSILLFCIPLLLGSCQSIKDGLSGKKNENSDEFLVQKKNPLVLPPNYMKLPKPKSEVLEDTAFNIEEETDIEKLFNTESTTTNSSSKNYGDAEEFVLENIK